MSIEIIRLILPFITFLIGLACVPLVESLKDRTKRKALYENMVEELNDEIINLESAIPKMSSCILFLEAFLNGDEKGARESGGAIKYIPRDITVMFIDDVFKNNYKYLKSHQRKALKSMPMQISGINNSLKEISEIEVSQERMAEQIQLCKNFIYTACCLRATMIEFVRDECLEDSDEAIINSQLQSLGVDGLLYESLVKKRSVTIKLD